MTRLWLLLMMVSGATACTHYDRYAPRPSSYQEPAAVTADPGYGFPPAGQYWMGSPGVAGWGYYGGPTTSVYSPTPSQRPTPISTPPSVTTRPPAGVPGGRGSSGGGISNRPQRSSVTRTPSSHRQVPPRDEK